MLEVMRARLRWAWMAGSLLLELLAAPHALANPAPTRVSVLTMGPGRHPFTRFGHNALLLEWTDGRSVVYNFGTFEFDGARGALDFMTGHFRYWLSVGSLPGVLAAYGAEGRSLAAQELELSADERQRLAVALERNARPEQRYYDYDYYRDNCSTRVRDALASLLGSEFARGVHGPGRATFRQHTLRAVQDAPWLYLGLDLALGAPTDREISRWDELFLPAELHDELGRAQRVLDGASVPLVRRERRLLSSRLAIERRPDASTRLAGRTGAVGVVLGGGLWLLGRAAREKRAALRAFGVASVVLSTLLGLLGAALLVFMSSKHWAAHQNPSVLACPVWVLALGVFASAGSFGDRSRARPLRYLLVATAAATTVSALLAFASAGVDALPIQALFFPLWLGFWWGARELPSSR